MNVQAVTITLNPAIDQTVQLQQLSPGGVHHAYSSDSTAGGKGINVAVCLADWGMPTAVLGVLGADNVELFEQLFDQRGIVDHCLRAPGRTRTNIHLLETSSGETTHINLPGLTLEADAVDAVAARLSPHLRQDLPVVLSGSLPTGLPVDAWARLQRQAVAAGARVLLDTSGPALMAALQAELLPFAVKPNRHDLEAWTGTSLDERNALLSAARALLKHGVKLVVVSMDSDGVLFVNADGALQAQPPRLTHGSSVDAGDAMAAGLIAGMLARNPDIETCARLSTAFALNRLASGDARRLDPSQVITLAAAVRIEHLPQPHAGTP